MCPQGYRNHSDGTFWSVSSHSSLSSVDNYHSSLDLQTRDSSDRLIVNFDPQLSEVLSEIRHLKRSPLNIRLPSHLSRLAREVDPSELRHRRTSLEVVVQTYNEIRQGLSQVEENLFLHKLQQTEQVRVSGVDEFITFHLKILRLSHLDI